MGYSGMAGFAGLEGLRILSRQKRGNNLPAWLLGQTQFPEATRPANTAGIASPK